MASASAQYAWCTSPLRRYVDLVNQRQLLALAQQQCSAIRRAGRRPVRDRLGIRRGLHDRTPTSRRASSATGACAGSRRRASRASPRRVLKERTGAPRRACRSSCACRACRRCRAAPHVELDILERDEVELSLAARFHAVLGAATPERRSSRSKAEERRGWRRGRRRGRRHRRRHAGAGCGRHCGRAPTQPNRCSRMRDRASSA